MHTLGATLSAEEKALLAEAAKDRADIIDRYDKVIIFCISLLLNITQKLLHTNQVQGLLYRMWLIGSTTC